MPGELPTTLLGLFIAIVLGQSILLAWLVRGIKGDQSRIADTLDKLENNQITMLTDLRLATTARENLTPVFVGMTAKIDIMADKMLDVMLRLAEGARVAAAAAAGATTKNGEPVK